MATKKSMEEEIIVEGNLSDVFNSVSNSLDSDIYKNLSINNDLYQISANYKYGSIKGEIFVHFTSESEQTTKIKIKSSAIDSMSSFMSSSEVILEMFKDYIKPITKILTSNYKKTFNNNNSNNYPTPELFLTIKRTKQELQINQPIKISIDNDKEYEIENGNNIEMPILYGMHNIKFSCGTQNKILDINIIENTTIHIKFNRTTGCIETDLENKDAPYNTLCVVGVVVSGISLLLNFYGIVGIIGTVISIAGLLNCKKRNENGEILAIIGIAIGIFSILYSVYMIFKMLYSFSQL